MSFEVRLDREPVGALVVVGTARKVVRVAERPPGSPDVATTIREEAVTRLSGTVELTAGQHDILLLPHGVVDGQLDRIRIVSQGGAQSLSR
jgi:hypothetical protein